MVVLFSKAKFLYIKQKPPFNFKTFSIFSTGLREIFFKPSENFPGKGANESTEAVTILPIFGVTVVTVVSFFLSSV